MTSIVKLLAAVALTGSLLSCIKAKEEPADLGPEVEFDKISSALSKAVQGADISQLAIGQYITYSTLRRLENEEATTTMGGTKVEVFSRVETETEVKFTLRIIKSVRLSDGTFEVRQSEEPLVLKKKAITENLIFGSPVAKKHAEFSAHATAKPTRTSYHRLKEFTESIPAPPLVRAKPDCGGIPSCRLNVRYVQFDIVQWFDDGTFQKVSIDFGFSLDTPFLPFGKEDSFDQWNGVMVMDCRSTQVQVESRTIYVRDCMNLEDFQK